MISFSIGKLERCIEIQQRLVSDTLFRDEISDILLRYTRGDWGDTEHDICSSNTLNTVAGGEISARYHLSDGRVIFITTDAPHGKTVMMFED